MNKSKYIKNDALLAFAVPAQKAYADAYKRHDGLLNISDEYVLVTLEKMQEIVENTGFRPVMVRWEGVYATWDANIYIEGVLITCFADQAEFMRIGWLQWK